MLLLFIILFRLIGVVSFFVLVLWVCCFSDCKDNWSIIVLEKILVCVFSLGGLCLEEIKEIKSYCGFKFFEFI